MMIPLKAIVAPTDFSDASKEGVRAAVAIAKHFSATIHLVHVVTPIPEFMGAHAPTGFHIPSVLKELEDGARSSLQELIDEELPGELDVDSKVFTGDPATEIVNLAGEAGADLIVMATHGATGWKRLVTGSVTEKVIRYSKVPVLSVRGSEGGDEENTNDR
jgi:nucleotide-binding universal stress UspA family protein